MALNKFFTPALLIALAAAQSVPVQAVDIDTAQILESTTRAIIADSCPQARPFGIGYCVWMTCTPVGCSVSTSIKYANYNPDAVVSAYHNTGKNPWTEMRVISTLTKEAMDELANATLDAMEGVFDTRLPFDIDFQGGNQTEAKGLEGENLVFKEADIFGHPWQMLGDPLISGTLACPTSSQSFMPYYQSILDMLAWRNP
ncbi:MAG: TraU family protein, partial [Gammaproteobacteria bacterium]|nr:TraU family protein [Gammaproteobacteria bacterium]